MATPDAEAGCFGPSGLVVSCVRRANGRLWIRVIGDLDAIETAEFHAQVWPLLTRPTRCIELDLAGMGFCDAAGGRELLRLFRGAAQQKINLVVVAAHPVVEFVLGVIGGFSL
ncbi:STAS domain-containing protein [Actinoplanes sp. NPDC051475]|uniref:STAS domain-containing protein n=1 Tax=Actinoplanes sp. NPDC051475 TaxID=3157225 RepID=UPI00344B2FB9